MERAAHTFGLMSADQPEEMAPAIPSLLRPESLAEQAYAAIRASIWAGAIAANTYYSEVQLAGALGISRTPVREALIRLVREGFVEVAPQRGFRLRSITDQECEEAIELSEVTEEFVVRRLAGEVDEAGLMTLASILDRQRQSLDDPSQFVVVDEDFHLAMPELLHLERTRGLLATLRGIMWLSGLGSHTSPDSRANAIEEHRALLDALVVHDPEAAARSVQRHMRFIRQMLAERGRATIDPIGSARAHHR